MAENYTSIFVTVITFLGVIVLLIGWIPPAFFSQSETYRSTNVPDDFDASDVEFYNITWGRYLNSTDAWYYAIEPDYWHCDVGGGDLGGWDINWVYSKANLSHHNFWSEHRHTEWWIIPMDHAAEHFCYGNSRGTILSAEEIEADLGDNNLVKYRAECPHFTYHFHIGYNTSIYDSVVDAWDHGRMLGVGSIEFDEMNTGFSAWGIISALLWFQLPGVHWMVNAIIAIPIYAAIAIVTFLLLMKFIEALPFT